VKDDARFRQMLAASAVFRPPSVSPAASAAWLENIKNMSGQELVECASRAGLLDDCCSPDPALPRLVHMMLMGRGDKVVFGLRAGGEPGWRRDQSASAQRPSGFDWGATKVAWEIRRGALPEETAHK
jgi:hypothetical protein